MLTYDNCKAGSESSWYEAVTERDTAQHPHVRKRNLLGYMVNVTGSTK